MTDDQIRELLREMREDPVPADSLARVRSAVAARRVSRFGWKMMAGVVAAVCALLVILVWPRTPAPIELALPRPIPPAPPVMAGAPTAVVRRTSPAPAIAGRARKPNESVVIRIETPDPEVVIWLVGE